MGQMSSHGRTILFLLLIVKFHPLDTCATSCNYGYMKILLIDDEEAILDVFKQALSQGEFEVITATTGNQGMEMTRKEHPDLIFLDQILPDINGNEVLQQLKADPETKQIPIAVLSNYNQDTLVATAMKMGASDYILKYQVAPSDLVKKAHELFDNAYKAKSATPTVDVSKI